MREAKYKEPVVCVHCGKEIKNLLPDDIDFQMIDCGVVGKLMAPYGSRFDGSVFQIGLCDDCIEILQVTERINVIADYISGEGFDE